MQTNKSKLVFKDYNHNQNLLLPPSLDELIDKNHPVRIVNQVIDQLDIEPLIKRYKGGGTSSYHPRLMLKVLIYGYLTNLYSSRKIEQALHQTTTDTTTLSDHMKSLESTLGKMPEVLVADAGYGSEQNYEYLEENGVEAYVKYNYFHIEQSKKWKENPYRVENLHYNQHKDCYYCPMGQAMTFVYEKKDTTINGYKQNKRVYQAQNCNGCPMRSSCHKGKYNRKIEVNPKLIRYKAAVRKKLNSEKGKYYRGKRPVEPEAVFGMIKSNRNYRRFLLRGLEKVEIEAGLLSLAHNIKKMAS